MVECKYLLSNGNLEIGKNKISFESDVRSIIIYHRDIANVQKLESDGLCIVTIEGEEKVFYIENPDSIYNKIVTFRNAALSAEEFEEELIKEKITRSLSESDIYQPSSKKEELIKEKITRSLSESDI